MHWGISSPSTQMLLVPLSCWNTSHSPLSFCTSTVVVAFMDIWPSSVGMPSLSLKLIITYTTITQPTMVAVITPMSRMVIRHLKTAETAFRVWRTAGFFITARHFPDLRESAICLASLLY